MINWMLNRNKKIQTTCKAYMREMERSAQETSIIDHASEWNFFRFLSPDLHKV